MLGLDAAGKTTILYKLHIGEVLSTAPTIGFNVEKVQYKNVMFTVWDVSGQEKLRPFWRHYFNDTNGLIYVVDSLDRERIGKAKVEFQAIINDPFMINCVILVFANKQDMHLKGKYAAWLKLRNKFGYVYNPSMNTFNLTNEEWESEMKSNRYIETLRHTSLPHPDLCSRLFDDVIATGDASWGPTTR